MWCNKYKKFGSDRWAIKKTVQKFVFVHYTELDCCYTVTSLYKAQPWGCSPDGKWRSASRGHRRLFLHKAGLAVIPTCAKKQHLGHFPQKQQQKNKTNKQQKPCPALSNVSHREEKSYNTVSIPMLLQEEEVSILKHLSYVLFIYISVNVWPS